jgi:BirA family transcriptional regulator, biotin operon repressor / biotin---[acetyl-CoA-carboxylase] ligase
LRASRLFPFKNRGQDAGPWRFPSASIYVFALIPFVPCIPVYFIQPFLCSAGDVMRLPLIHLTEIDSTQAFLGRHPELGDCGVLADAQTAGQGRGGNSWESAPGAGLWLSARVPVPELAVGVMLQRAMAAVIVALESCEVTLGLKWPNDLVAWRGDRLVKLGGIIGEMGKGRMILGAGVNLTDAPLIPDRAIPPASLVSMGARDIPERLTLAEEILSRWQDLEHAPAPPFRWPQPDDAIRWEEGQGTCLGWAKDGRLKVRTEKDIELLSVGDVSGLRA